MAEPAFKRTMNTNVVAHEPIAIRRFEMPDIDRHLGWMIPRLVKLYPHLTPQNMAGWLRSMLYNAEFLFLYQDNAVALAQAVTGHTLSPKPVIHERFVLVRDSSDKEQVAAAAAFYLDFVRWAKAKDAEAVILSESSDVAQEAIQKVVSGRIFTKEQTFLRW